MRSRSAHSQSLGRQRRRTRAAPMPRPIAHSRRFCVPATERSSLQTFTLAAVAGWRDELTAQGLAPSSVARRVRPCGAWPRRSAPTRSSRRCAARTSNTNAPAPCPIASSPVCSRAPICARRSAPETARSSNSSRARDCAAQSSRASPSMTSRSAAANPTNADAQRSPPSVAIRRHWRSSCADQNAGALGPCRCTPRRTTSCGAGTPPGRAHRPMRCSSAQTPVRDPAAAQPRRDRRHRHQARRRGRRPRGPAHRTRTALHVLHDARRTRRRARGHPRPRRPRRRTHHPDLRRRQRSTQGGRHRRT